MRWLRGLLEIIVLHIFYTVPGSQYIGPIYIKYYKIYIQKVLAESN